MLIGSESGVDRSTLARLRAAASDSRSVSNYTHSFYRYPGRFSPQFVSSVIQCFSSPGESVLDPYMGGGTTLVESMILGRRGIGIDINELSVFVASCKISPLSVKEQLAVQSWADDIVPYVRANDVSWGDSFPEMKNMHLPKTRWLRKTIAALLQSIPYHLPTHTSQRFARCTLLSTGQKSLNGRKVIPDTAEFRLIVQRKAHEMLLGVSELEHAISQVPGTVYRPILYARDTEDIDSCSEVRRNGPIDLVVTSPPYPGIHMLYHRWQVDGRKETDAPYWIAGCTDGSGARYYNFGDRRPSGVELYFSKAARSFRAIRNVMKPCALLVQLVAFSEPRQQLPRYLSMLNECGFTELSGYSQNRIWRSVPSRRWYAAMKGSISASREVVLIHRAA